MRRLLPALALAFALLAPAPPARAAAGLVVTPAPPSGGRLTTVALIAETRPTAGPRALSIALGPAAEIRACRGVLFAGALSPAVIPCAVEGVTAGVAAEVPPHGLLLLIVQAEVVAAGEFAADALADGEALTYRARAAWRSYLPAIHTGATP